MHPISNATNTAQVLALSSPRDWVIDVGWTMLASFGFVLMAIMTAAFQ